MSLIDAIQPGVLEKSASCYVVRSRDCGLENVIRKPMNPFESASRNVFSLGKTGVGFLLVLFFGGTLLGQGLRQQAEQKFGGDSRIWLTEGGDTGLGKWDAVESKQETGIILEWNSKSVVLVRPNAERETSIPGDFVSRIEPHWTDPAGGDFHKLFTERDFTAAIKLGSETIKKPGIPVWQQRIILAEMIESMMALGKPRLACQLFVSLAKENSPQLLLSTIPVSWGDEKLEGEAVTIQPKASEWLLSDNEAIQLLGASWLLSGAQRPLGIETLTSLSKSKTPWIGSYARCQLWRIAPPAEIRSTLLPKWIAERDRIPFALQAGPSTLLAHRMAQAGEPMLAASEWLRIATLHSDRYHFANRAWTKAIDSLDTLGKKEDAARARKLHEQFVGSKKFQDSKK